MLVSSRAHCKILDYIKIIEHAEFLGTTWHAEPLCEAPRGLLVLDLHVVSFDSNYYGTAKGTITIHCLYGSNKHL